MTTIEPVTIRCAVCGERSEHHVVASTSALGPPDLDSRPSELARSTLGCEVAVCPACGVVFDPADPPTDDDAAFLGELVETPPYRALRDGPLPATATAFLCRALIRDAEGAFAAAGWDSLRAAWVCDDERRPEEAVACRLRALERWDHAVRAGEPLLEADDEPLVPLLLADTYRRAERWRAAIVAASDGAEAEADPEVQQVLAFVADRAWAQDARRFTLTHAANAEPVGDPTSRRVAFLGPAALGPFQVIHAIDLAEGRLELRRREAGDSAWFVAGEGGDDRQVSVFEAEWLATGESEGELFRVLEATAAELQWWGADAAWTVSLREPHPSDNANVRGLHEEWQTAWRRLEQADAAEDVDEVTTDEFAAWLDEQGDAADGFRALVVPWGEVDDPWPQLLQPVVAAVLDHVLEQRASDSVAIFEAGTGYVQTMFRRDHTTLYAEAADPRGQADNELTDEQRGDLERLGWHDPKVDPVPYPDAQYAAEWTGGNLARELPLAVGSEEMARTVVTTLAEVYAAEGDAPLEVHVFDAVV